jgi:amidohydrolase
VFQPAEEVMGAGATEVIAAGALDGVDRIFALHCDPREVVGQVGLKVGGITGSADQVTVRLTGQGGHTARPHITADVVYALGEVITRLPSALSRRVDPRAGLSLVWGRVTAGTSPNVIPDRGEVSGTVRCLDVDAWDEASSLITRLAQEIVAPYAVGCVVDYVRGVPPVINDRSSVAILAAAARSVLGPAAIHSTEQSLGGEDFAWYLDKVPGALLRLGVRGEKDAPPVDLHRGDFDVDETAIGIGVRVLVATALLALS